MGDSKAAAHWTFTVKETVLKAEPVTTPSPSPSPSGKK